MLDVEDWAEIRRLRRVEGMAISEIARVMGVARNTVKAALAAEGPPRYRRAPGGSLADGVEGRVRELLAAYPTMPATVIAERIGWSYSIRTLSGRVAQLRPLYLPADPAGRTSYAPGEIARCDFWFPDIVVPVGFGHTHTAKQLPVLTRDCCMEGRRRSACSSACAAAAVFVRFCRRDRRLLASGSRGR